MSFHVNKLTGDFKKVPVEKWPVIVTRTVIGLLFVALGVWLLATMVEVLRHSQTFNLWLFVAGVTAIVLGATTWSTKIVSTPVRFVLASLRDAADIVRGRTPPPAPPAGGDP